MHFTVKLHLLVWISYITLKWCMCVFYHSHCNSHNVFSLTCSWHWTETNSCPPTRKVHSYNVQPAKSTANAIQNATYLHLPARKIISLWLKFRTPPLFSHLIGSASCLNTVKFAGYEHEYDSVIPHNVTGTSWGAQLLTPLSKQPTHLQNVTPVLELMVICTYSSNFISATVTKKMS